MDCYNLYKNIRVYNTFKCVCGRNTFNCIFVLGYRIFYRVYRRTLLYIPFKYSADQRRVMIVGAGSAGTMIINEMMARRKLKV